MRTTLALILFTLSLTACGNESAPQVPIATSANAVAFSLSCDTQTSTASHLFRSWGTYTADKFACSGLSAHTCEKRVSGTLTEYECETTNTATQASVPSGCAIAFTGWAHEFADGTTRTMNAYYCGALGALDCWYYAATDGSKEGDLLCRD